MITHKTSSFLKTYKKLPQKIKKLFKKQESIFRETWLHPFLHTKKLEEMAGVFSFRVTREYRVLFYFRDEVAIFFSIGHRKDIYR